MRDAKWDLEYETEILHVWYVGTRTLKWFLILSEEMSCHFSPENITKFILRVFFFFSSTSRIIFDGIYQSQWHNSKANVPGCLFHLSPISEMAFLCILSQNFWQSINIFWMKNQWEEEANYYSKSKIYNYFKQTFIDYELSEKGWSIL